MLFAMSKEENAHGLMHTHQNTKIFVGEFIPS
jgi:hypothetical protein